MQTKPIQIESIPSGEIAIALHDFDCYMFMHPARGLISGFKSFKRGDLVVLVHEYLVGDTAVDAKDVSQLNADHWYRIPKNKLLILK